VCVCEGFEFIRALVFFLVGGVGELILFCCCFIWSGDLFFLGM